MAGRSWKEVSNAADERDQEEEEQHRHREGAAEDGQRRGEAAREVRLLHHVANRVLEDEREEDADEDDEERAPDRDECRDDTERGHDEQRAHRHE